MTRIQHRNLQLYLVFRDEPLSVARLLWYNRRIYLILLLAYVFATGLIYFSIGTTGAEFAGVAFAVVILRDIAHFRRTVSVWPVLQEVFNWDKIEELLAADSK